VPKSKYTQAVAQTVFLNPALVIVQKSLLAAQKSFFDNSKASSSTANPKLALQAQTVGFAGVSQPGRH
jgi:hypothetical protein